MAATSPDSFYHIRVSNSNMRATHYNLQSMEFNAHNRAVCEYDLDILQYFLELEPKTLPNLSLIQQQPEINLKMRPLLLDFLMDVINKLSLSKSTFPLTVNLIDRYCSTRIVKKQHYQLLGLTSLWIACKNSDSKFKIPSLYDLCKMCCNCYDKKLFLEMENHLLKSLNWVVESPTFDSFIDIFLNSLISSNRLAGTTNLKKISNDLKILAIYICELIQFYPNIYFNYSTSQISLCGLMTSLLIIDPHVDLGRMLEYLNKLTPTIILTASSFNTLFNSLVKILKCPPPSLKLKYFNDKGKFIHLMKELINFTNKNIVPMTPKINTVMLPPTPVSNSISPKVCKPENPLGISTDASNSPITNTPEPNTGVFDVCSPNNIPRKRTTSGTTDKDPILKRSKSMGASFFISS